MWLKQKKIVLAQMWRPGSETKRRKLCVDSFLAFLVPEAIPGFLGLSTPHATSASSVQDFHACASEPRLPT